MERAGARLRRPARAAALLLAVAGLALAASRLGVLPGDAHGFALAVRPARAGAPVMMEPGSPFMLIADEPEDAASSIAKLQEQLAALQKQQELAKLKAELARLQEGAPEAAAPNPLAGLGLPNPLEGVGNPFQGAPNPLEGVGNPFQGVPNPVPGLGAELSAEAARAAAGPQDPLTFGLAWAGVLAFVALAIAGVNVYVRWLTSD